MCTLIPPVAVPVVICTVGAVIFSCLVFKIGTTSEFKLYSFSAASGIALTISCFAASYLTTNMKKERFICAEEFIVNIIVPIVGMAGCTIAMYFISKVCLGISSVPQFLLFSLTQAGFTIALAIALAIVLIFVAIPCSLATMVESVSRQRQARLHYL